MTKPEEMPKFVEWSQSFVPPARPSGYISQHLSVTDTVLLLNLLTPPLIEVEGCILFKDRYSPTTYKQWSDQLNGSVQDIESVINQVNLWDIFDPQDPAEESALEDIARTLVEIWPEHAHRAFPDLRFEGEVTDSYGPGATLFQA